MAAIHTQYEAHMKATSGTHNTQIQMVLGRLHSQGAVHSGSVANNHREKLDSKVFTKVDMFDGERKDWSFTFKSAVRSSSHDAFDLLNWAEKEDTEIIDVATQAPDNIENAIWTALCSARSRCS